jgi:hypothetical protein
LFPLLLLDDAPLLVLPEELPPELPELDLPLGDSSPTLVGVVSAQAYRTVEARAMQARDERTMTPMIHLPCHHRRRPSQCRHRPYQRGSLDVLAGSLKPRTKR